MPKMTQFLKTKKDNKYRNYLSKYVQDIRKMIEFYQSYNEDQIKEEFNRIREFPPEKNKLIRVYALATIMVERIKGLKLFDVQLMGAVALAENKIAEMKTGEGKTITSCLPVIFRASRQPVHVCTVNEYLAKRDKEYLEEIYEFFDLSVGLNLQTDSKETKQENYNKDIVYSTANTLGFDYLNDNLVHDKNDKVNKANHRAFALIDEVDLVLIDEARTPLIIGHPQPSNNHIIALVQHWIEQLESEIHYTVDMKSRSVTLTKEGESTLTELARVDNLYAEEHIELLHLIYQSLQANFIFKPDVDYAVILHENKKKIAIIDTYTGRIQVDRRFSQGLHQAIEAKHIRDGVEILDETKTVATITLQNFFLMYSSIAGMSGTSHEDEQEFFEVYGTPVIQIPTNKPLNRLDNPIQMVRTKSEKWDTVISKVAEYHQKEYPILLGTVSVEDSEEVSRLLSRVGLEHTVLNAKQDANEANIIAKAGLKSAITVATNMAGRGTDIKCESKEHPLVVFSTELNESSRIDNQLKGRTSRQGAYGITETIISAEDGIFKKTSMSDNLKMITKGIGSSKLAVKVAKNIQEELEGQQSASRKQTLKYDDVIREQRSKFYEARDKILFCNDYHTMLMYAERIGTDIEKLDIDLSKRYQNTVGKLELLRHYIIHAMDLAWVKHIDILDCLKSIIGWRGQNGHNPIIIYQNEASILYNNFKQEILAHLLIISATNRENNREYDPEKGNE